MVNTELRIVLGLKVIYYNILNIVVNTEPIHSLFVNNDDYNILNIVVNTERCRIK